LPLHNELVFEHDAYQNSLVRPIALEDGTEVDIGVSLGAAFYPTDAPDAQELVSRADLAMYRARQARSPPSAFTIPAWMRSSASARRLRPTSECVGQWRT
jgi:predicted signal transduction protein with EAL and GGDEF domain